MASILVGLDMSYRSDALSVVSHDLTSRFYGFARAVLPRGSDAPTILSAVLALSIHIIYFVQL